MIFTERTITVVNDSATINKPLILYRGDKNIELKITIAESQFKFRNTDASNVIETTDASYAQLVINTPYNSPIFSDVAATKNGAVIFVITEAMIDEIREVGAYEIQIRLLDDNKQSRASIPPVSNAIEIREPIAIEDGSAVDSNAVNVAKVNRALTTTSAPLEAFDSQGNYIKKTWGDGDPITDAALNKMEAAIDGVNKKIGNNRSQIKEIVSQVGTETLPTTSQTLKGSIRELFQFVSNGKTLIASAITDMGIDASNTDSFEAMANKIRTIIAQQPLYTFGLLSDVHVDGDGTDEAHSISDLTNALSFLENAGADFIAYTGDMTYNGRDEDYTSLKTCLETSTVPNYCVRGNHDAYSLADGYASATGCKEDYIITQNNDLLIFISCADTNHDTGGLTTSKLDWLENLLQTNTSTRVFLFYHYFVDGTSGNGTGVYPYGTLNPSNAIALRFINMVKQYPNLIYCNGHSHMRFNIQDQDANANYYHNDGECYYIHIPSTAKPRFPSGDTVADYYEGSEGYLVEVYANKVIFKPIDFIASEYLTKYNYTANVAQGTNEPTLPPEPTIIDIAWNDGVKIDRSTGTETSNSEYSASDFIACDNSKTYTLNLASDSPTHGCNVFACYYDENKSFISCGSDFIGSYQLSSDVYTADLSLPTNAKYIKLRLFAANDTSTMDKSIITLTTLAITT